MIDVDALSKRVVTVGPREEMEVEQPFTGGAARHRADVRGRGRRRPRSRAPARPRRAWARTSFAERAAILLRFHDLVLDRQDEILDLLQLESGKARRHAFEEVLDVAIVARYYANTAERHLAPRRRRGALPLLTAAYEHHHPLGVVGIIAPWNYPLTLSDLATPCPRSRPATPSCIKPDGQTPFTALWGVALLEEAGLPAGPRAGRHRLGLRARPAR